MRVAAVGDLHCKRNSQGNFQSLFAAMAGAAEAIVLCGDLTDLGLAEEARVLVKEMVPAKSTPIVAVLGNHDYESGEVEQVKAILGEAGVALLDGDAVEIQGVGFAGAKGLGGGFGQRALQPWGEEIMKRFVREAIDEALKLESALAKLRTSQQADGDLRLPRFEPARGAAPALSRERGLPRSRASRNARGADPERRARLQRVPAAPHRSGGPPAPVQARGPGPPRGIGGAGRGRLALTSLKRARPPHPDGACAGAPGRTPGSASSR
jgi:hypothetical protein